MASKRVYSCVSTKQGERTINKWGDMEPFAIDPLEFLAEERKLDEVHQSTFTVHKSDINTQINTQYTRMVSQICHESIVKV